MTRLTAGVQSVSQLTLSGVAVEKGTNTVISANFGVNGEPAFNNLRANFGYRNTGKEFFNSHRRFHVLRIGGGSLSVTAILQQLSR